MKTFLLTLIMSFALGHFLAAQNSSSSIDVLLFEPVVGDPLSSMLPMPTGFDNVWINYDGDKSIGHCVINAPTPLGWFIDFDFSVPDASQTTNDAFISCSFLSSANIQNDNWLILPPVEIPDSSYQLCWRSLFAEGPAFVDGYKVLASTGTNLPGSGDFSHVLFTAAETIKQISGPQHSLNPADYKYSDGYIHANGLTDTNYFYLLAPGGPLRGKLEPHCVSLAAFAGQIIYLAFHHDSHDDTELQIDDILVSNGSSVLVHQPSNIVNFNILPNPVLSHAYVQWNLVKPEGGRLLLYDLSGKPVLEKAFSPNDPSQLYLDLQTVSPGLYQCVLQTASGRATRKLVKL